MNATLLVTLLTCLVSLPKLQAEPGEDLLNAIKSKNLDAMRETIAQGAAVDGIVDNTTPLVHSLDRGVEWNPISEALLTLGASVEAPTGQGRTPLMAASRTGNVPMMKLLIGRHAQPNTASKAGTRALTYAIESGTLEAVQTLIDAGASVTDDSSNCFVLDATYRGDFEMTALLLKNGANVNAANRWGYTPLMNAAEGNLPKLLKLLLAKGADANATHEVQGAEPHNALCCAVHAKSLAAAQALLEHGMDPHWQKDSAIAIARGTGRKDLIDLLTTRQVARSQPTPSVEPEDKAVAFPVGQKWTVAIASFFTDDNSWRSAESCADFSSVLQASLGSVPEITLVERSDIRRAEAELGLQALGALGRNNPLRLGQWIQAQMLVTGRFSADEAQGSHLVVEVIDLHRADVLARRSRVISMPADKRFVLLPEHVQECLPMVKSAIAEAATTMNTVADQIIVAPLFLRNTTKASSRLDFMEGDFMAALGKAQSEKVRIAQFPNASSASQETELVISGLVDADRAAWKRVADYYIWGEYQEQESDGVPFDEVRVDLLLNVWDGATAPVEEVATFKVGAMNQAISDSISKVISRLKTKPAPPSDLVRDQIAQSLRTRANAVVAGQSKGFREGSEGWLNQWRVRLSLLELANFFRPGDPKDEAELLLERGNRDAVFWGGYSDYSAAQFRALWKQNAGWREHVDRHGFGPLKALQRMRPTDSALPFGPGLEGPTSTMNRVNHYVSVTGSVLQHVDKKWGGYPDELPWSVHQQWWQTLAEELAHRLVKVAEEFPSDATLKLSDLVRYISGINDVGIRADGAAALWKLSKHASDAPDEELQAALKKLLESSFRNAGRAGETQGLLAYTAQRRPKSHYEYARKILRSDAALTSINQMEAKRLEHEKQLLTESKAELLSGEIRLPVKFLPLDPDFDFFAGVTTIVHHDGGLVFAAQAMYRKTYNPCLGVWINDLSSGASIYQPSLEVRNTPLDTRILPVGSDLWYAVSGLGAARVSESTGLTKFSERDGLPTTAFQAVAQGGGELFFGGGLDKDFQLAAFNLATNKWSTIAPPNSRPTGHVTQLAFSNDRLLVIDYVEGSHLFSLFDTKARSWIPAPSERLGYQTVSVASSPKGFWIGNKSTLLFLGAASQAPEPVAFADPLPGDISSLLFDDDGVHLWLATSGIKTSKGNGIPFSISFSPRIYCIDTTSKRVVSFARLPYNAAVKSMAAHQGQLWIGLNQNLNREGCILEATKSSFFGQK